MPAFLQHPGAAQSYLWAIILLPLAGALANGLFGKRWGKGNAALVALGVVGGSAALSAMAFAWVASEPSLVLHHVGQTWFRVAGAGGEPVVSVGWGLLVDRLSGTLILVVTGVGFLIHVYSASYMWHEDEGGYARYFTYLNLFVAAMLTLVLGDGLVLTFVGWEGVGLCSYLLIGFWYTDEQKAFCGRKAFVVNRVGDFGFLLGVFALLSIFGTADYGELARLATPDLADKVLASGPFAGWTVRGALTFATLGLFVGCAGKSAQLPLYVWLPDAMAGPTPVSALIHAATMVTAGVYLVARVSFLFALSPTSMAVVTTVGAATALFSAVIAFAQTDIKKVLAYSTVSQLGFMFIGVGVGAWFAGVLHLVTHAFFKALLFLAAGSVMHGMGDDTDIRNMGGLWGKMPSTARTFLVGTLAITGIAPLSGFFSKDAILAGALFSHTWYGTAAYVVGTLAAAGTAFYMVRLFALTFAGAPRTEPARHAHESSPVMTVPLWILAVLSVVALVLGLPGEGPWGEAYRRFTGPVFAQARGVLGPEGHHAAWPFLLAWAVAAGFGWLGWSMYAGALRGAPERLALRFPRTYRLVEDKFRVDELYGILVVEPLHGAARVLSQAVDRFVIEGVLVNGSARFAALLGRTLRRAQNGDAQRYAAAIAIAAAVLLWLAVRGAP